MDGYSIELFMSVVKSKLYMYTFPIKIITLLYFTPIIYSSDN